MPWSIIHKINRLQTFLAVYFAEPLDDSSAVQCAIDYKRSLDASLLQDDKHQLYHFHVQVLHVNGVANLGGTPFLILYNRRLQLHLINLNDYDLVCLLHKAFKWCLSRPPLSCRCDDLELINQAYNFFTDHKLATSLNLHSLRKFQLSTIHT